ncbi:hypothetical protein I204_02716 [Kwoniella mangroviensis CBS 8886]|nr:hypothetical protein I204_02716 [Kwoniella mangroviensis CBS 8886]
MVFGNSLPSNRSEHVLNYWTDRQTKYISDGTVGPGSIPSSALPELSFPTRQDHSVYPKGPRPRILSSDIDDDNTEEENPRKLRVGISPSTSTSRETATGTEEGTKKRMKEDGGSEASMTKNDIRTDSQSTNATSKTSDEADQEDKKEEKAITHSERFDSTVSSNTSSNTGDTSTKGNSDSESSNTVTSGWRSVPVTTTIIPNGS